MGRAQRQETQPRAQPKRRLHPAVGHRGDDVAAHPCHRPDDGREARQVDVDLERLRRQNREVAAGQHELLDVVLHLVEHRIGQRRRWEHPPSDLGLFAIVPARPAEPGPEDPLGNPPLGQRVGDDRDGVLVLTGPVPQGHAESLAQEDLDRIAQEAIQQVDVDRLHLALQGVGQEPPESLVLLQRGAGAVEVELVEAPGPGRDELARFEIARVERLQRVLDNDGITGST